MAHVSLRKHARASLACSRQQQLEAKQTLKFLFTLGSALEGEEIHPNFEFSHPKKSLFHPYLNFSSMSVGSTPGNVARSSLESAPPRPFSFSSCLRGVGVVSRNLLISSKDHVVLNCL
jgi:hypothetical protein